MIDRIAFFVPGAPQTAGSKKALSKVTKSGKMVTNVVEDGSDEVRARKKGWRADVRAGGERARGPRPMFTGAALQATFVEVRKRPSAHLRTGKHAGELKDWATDLRPITMPDALKLARAAEDALTQVLYADDALIVDETLAKAYGDQVGLPVSAQGMIIVIRPAGAYRGPKVTL